MQPEISETRNKPDNSPAISIKDIAAHCNEFSGSDTRSSIFQLVTTLALFVGICILMFYSLEISYWITLLLAIPAAGLLTRIFIFQHDCGHESFFKSKEVNTWTGRFLSLLTVTPYDFWRRAHNLHHATSGNLGSRSIGGIDTVTMSEYKALSPRKKLAYRVYRNPLVLLAFGTPFYVLIAQRIPFNQPTHFYDDYKTLTAASYWKSVMLTNLALVVFFGALGLVVGFGALAVIYLPILIITSWLGGWLFYIQHQFEDTYWAQNENWDRQEAALMGSSYYVMPKVLQWFTGNIGLHHIHHLCSKIPNYKLQACMDARPELAHINRITLRESLGSLSLKIWDDQKGRLVRFDQIDMA